MSNQQDSQQHDRSEQPGRVMVFTGRGKGKTTAALGSLLRAWGWGWRTAVIQFMKTEDKAGGETRAAHRLGVEWHFCGTGCTWSVPDLEAAADRAREGWALAQRLIASGDYDLIMLDELTHPLRFGWLDPQAVVAWLAENRPTYTTVIITGRHAPQCLIDFADLATDMCNLKHPFEQGVVDQKGLEY